MASPGVHTNPDFLWKNKDRLEISKIVSGEHDIKTIPVFYFLALKLKNFSFGGAGEEKS